MDINEFNKDLYEKAFIASGEYGNCNSWKPSIDESEISEWCDKGDGHYVPATPLGYRDYAISRLEGLRNILALEDSDVDLDYEDAHNIKRDDGTIKLYDKFKMTVQDGGERCFVIVGDNETRFFVENENGERYYILYVNPDENE